MARKETRNGRTVYVPANNPDKFFYSLSKAKRYESICGGWSKAKKNPDYDTDRRAAPKVGFFLPHVAEDSLDEDSWDAYADLYDEVIELELMLDKALDSLYTPDRDLEVLRHRLAKAVERVDILEAKRNPRSPLQRFFGW